MSVFTLGARSRARLEGVDDRLVAIVHHAIALTTTDFGVFEGLRTRETQELFYARGVTRTLHSRHLTGRAVDLVPWIGGQFRWEWPAIYPVAVAMRQAALAHDTQLRWGGVWDRPLTRLGDNVASLQYAVAEYCICHAGPDFIDGPHYELMD